ncbi:protein-disulfide reductase DsbD [Pseudomonas sp. N040]|uniref:protein-disulfide reductase DsbD n=1 Tax=Pseudomonas sp. N040 TaxID=2785325 RepID=UPI0018A2B1E9|nr:protein-disulfide reductase DsbD [Pseudomonas sp. N040]MBF7731062.1 protein-disulfide reductase DsbD [Pseudomonas sp. N040]MBW7014705.1 protein-disulfide reductase DsbD [Pseudomonas sp. N040]
MRPLLLLFSLLLSLSASAGIFDQRPATSPGLGAALNNSADFLPVSEAFRPSLIERTDRSLRLRFTNAEGYYLYRQRFAASSAPAGVPLGKLQLPAGQLKQDEYFGTVEVYYGILDLSIPLDPAHSDPFTLLLTYQGCADQGLCYPPETTRLQIPAAGAGAATIPATPAQPAPPALAWHELLLFFLAGLGLTFTPCVLPMLPILSGVVLRGQVGGMRGFSLSLAYVLPMAACFALLGALMGTFGAELNLQARLQSPWVLVPFAIFFVAFALAMFGLYELRLPQALSAPLDRLAGKTRGGSLWGAAVLGIVSSLLVSPCVSAPLAGALLYISSSGDALGGGLKLFVLGLGMGTPLVLFATGGGALLPKSGTWMVGVRNAFGVLLLAVAIWLLERVLPGPLSLALWGLLAAGVALSLGTLEFTRKSARQRILQLFGLLLLAYAVACWVGALRGAADPLRPLGQAGAQLATNSQQPWTTLAQPEALAAALQDARAAGRPVLLDVYADWCISCKVIEREVLPAVEVREQLDGFRLLRFDMTASNAAQRALLDRYQLFGPPALLLFAADGREWRDLRSIGETTAAELAERLHSATAREIGNNQ